MNIVKSKVIGLSTRIWLTVTAVLTIIMGAQAQPNLGQVDTFLGNQKTAILNIVMTVIIIIMIVGLALAVNKVMSGDQDSTKGIVQWGGGLVFVIVGWYIITTMF